MACNDFIAKLEVEELSQIARRIKRNAGENLYVVESGGLGAGVVVRGVGAGADLDAGVVVPSAGVLASRSLSAMRVGSASSTMSLTLLLLL